MSSFLLPHLHTLRLYLHTQWTTLRLTLLDFYLGLKVSLPYLYAETRRNRRGFGIGLFTVFLVVCLVSLLQNSVLKSPVIFFKIAENSVGENDLVVYPGAGLVDKVTQRMDGVPLISQSRIDSGIVGDDLILGSTPRWLLISKIFPFPLPSSMASYIGASGLLLGINSEKEASIDVGRAWPYGTIPEDSVDISRSLVREIGYLPEQARDQSISIKISLFDFASSMGVIGNGGGGSGRGGSQTQGQLGEQQVKSFLALLIPQTASDQFWQQAFNVSLLFPSYRPMYSLTLPLDQRIVVASATLRNIIYSNQPLGIAVSSAIGFNITIPPPLGSQSIPQLLTLYNLATGQNVNQDQLYANIVSSFLFVNSTNGPLDPSVLLFRSLYGLTTNEDILVSVLPYFSTLTTIQSNKKVREVVDEPLGKWPESLGSVVLMEANSFLDIFKSGVDSLLFTNYTTINMGNIMIGSLSVPVVIPLPAPLSLQSIISSISPSSSSSLQSFESSFSSLNANQWSIYSIIQYTDRFSTYLKDLDGLTADLQQFTNAASLGIGLDYPVTFTIPIAIAMKTTIYVRYFLDNIFGSVIALIVLLGILLIYSLLLGDVESKTYEYGMLRALGMKQRHLIQILITKSFFFSIPGIGLGLLIAFLCNIPIAVKLASFANIPPTYGFFSIAIIEALLLGTIMPFVGNILPISRALSKTLRDSLDVYHHVLSDVQVKMIKLSDLGIDLWQSCIAVLLVVVGFITFYVVPYAFTFNKIPLFLGILNGILLGMLIGLCIISNAIQPLCERCILFLILLAARPHRHLRSIVTKNLSGHRSRNSKTAQMFTICLAFIIFAGAMFSLQASSIADNLRVFLGADINIMAGVRDFPNALNELPMTAYLDQQKQRREAGDPTAVVVDYSFLTYGLNWLDYMNIVRFSNLAAFPRVRNYVYGVPENLLHVIYDEFIQYTETNVGDFTGKTPSGLPDVVGAMYHEAGKATLPEERDDGHLIIPQSIGSASTNFQLNAQTVRNMDNMTQSRVDTSYSDYLDVIAGEGMRGQASVGIDTPTALMVQYFGTSAEFITLSYLCKQRGIVTKLPAFFYSSYRQTAGLGALLIRNDQYLRILRDVYPNWSDPTGLQPPTRSLKQRLLIRVSEDATLDQREDVINGLRIYFNSDKIQVADTRKIIQTTQIAVDFMNLFFIFVGIIAMILCFFILWISFSANVRENAWEFGVLRSLGLNNVEIVCVYIYEALSLVLTTIVLGSSIGITIAISLILQFNLFSELPFKFQFPFVLFFTMVSTSLVVAVAGSAIPARDFVKKSISQVIRMG